MVGERRPRQTLLEVTHNTVTSALRLTLKLMHADTSHIREIGKSHQEMKIEAGPTLTPPEISTARKRTESDEMTFHSLILFNLN